MADVTVQTNPTIAGDLAQQIVAILADHDSETRRRALQAAAMLLGETMSSQFSSGSATQADNHGDCQMDLATFFNRDEVLKPSDYAQLCAAYHFSLYGSVAFSMDELRAIANEAGVVLPDRLDMTLI